MKAYRGGLAGRFSQSLKMSLFSVQNKTGIFPDINITENFLRKLFYVFCFLFFFLLVITSILKIGPFEIVLIASGVK